MRSSISGSIPFENESGSSEQTPRACFASRRAADRNNYAKIERPLWGHQVRFDGDDAHVSSLPHLNTTATRATSSRHLLIPNGDGDAGHLNFTFENTEVDVIELAEGTYEVGREAETAEICLPVPTVSSRHALIRLSGDDSLTLTDLGSTNGTYVNGKELERNVETIVKSSDVVVFGDDHLASFIYDASLED